MGRIGLAEALVLVLVLLLLFGASRVPGIGAALGKAVREFRRAIKGDRSRPEGTESRKPD